jgi:hypothetical protein
MQALGQLDGIDIFRLRTAAQIDVVTAKTNKAFEYTQQSRYVLFYIVSAWPMVFNTKTAIGGGKNPFEALVSLVRMG